MAEHALARQKVVPLSEGETRSEMRAVRELPGRILPFPHDLLGSPAVELLRILASGAIAPGAGSNAAAIGAFAAAAGESVAHYSERKGDKEGDTELARWARNRGRRLRRGRLYLQRAADKDAQAYAESRIALWEESNLGGSGEARQQAALRDAADAAIKKATLVPLGIARVCKNNARAGNELLANGYKHARGEASVAVLCSVAACESALVTANENLGRVRENAWRQGRKYEVLRIYEEIRMIRKSMQFDLDNRFSL